MNFNSVEIYPTDMYVLKKELKFENLNTEILTLLYQPIIGLEAYSLYMFLCQETEMEFHPHSYICTCLNMNVNNFIEIRKKLEGIGLLRSYRKKEADRYSFIYKLQPPLTPKEFFENDIFSTLLMDAVREERYKDILKNFKLSVNIPEGYEEITSAIEDSYRFSTFYLRTNQREIKQLTQEINIDNRQLPNIVSNTDIDFELLLKKLNPRIIDLDSVIDNKKMISSLQKLYNLNVDELKLLITESIDLQTGILDAKVLQKNTVAYKKPPANYRKETEENVNDWKAKGIDQKIIDVFVVANSLSPIEFLDSIKEQKGGQRTSSEFFAIDASLKNGSLPIAVVNLVIYYLLVLKKEPSLPQKQFDNILDYLGQNNLLELSDVWLELQRMNKEGKGLSSNKANRNYRNTKNQNKKVIDSEWKNHDQITKVDEEKYKLMQEKLKQLK